MIIPYPKAHPSSSERRIRCAHRWSCAICRSGHCSTVNRILQISLPAQCMQQSHKYIASADRKCRTDRSGSRYQLLVPLEFPNTMVLITAFSRRTCESEQRDVDLTDCTMTRLSSDGHRYRENTMCTTKNNNTNHYSLPLMSRSSLNLDEVAMRES